MSLVAEAQERAERVIVSIVAEAPHAHSPTLEADRQLFQKIGADLVFAPPAQELFPFGRANSSLVVLPSLHGMLEGAADHATLADETTVVIKLLNIVKPDLGVFGERNFQQRVMIQRLVDDLFITLDVVGCAILRESNGLALATANRDLSSEQRSIAPRLQIIRLKDTLRVHLIDRL